MFQTSRSSEISLPASLGDDDHQQWHTISQTLMTCWFHIHCINLSTRLEKVLFTGMPEVLEEVTRSPRVKISEVNIVTPPQLNMTGGWELSPLQQIVIFERYHKENKTLIGFQYLLMDGRVLTDQFDRRFKLSRSDIERRVISIQLYSSQSH